MNLRDLVAISLADIAVSKCIGWIAVMLTNYATLQNEIFQMTSTPLKLTRRNSGLKSFSC